ncbi:ATP-dependent zinc metalloprotease FtsH [Streptococcus mitis]|uniref:ATP-dependent zinc metalloprotease FtsH n=3 Tax=Bacilli TaxID=91061 RepID=A0A6L5H5Y5_STRMT|nr:MULTISPECIES: ATP-dependent zinc metalloprotease FtsH [Streptococcus]MBS4947797.1 ATP-dependent zinc metalloprotease FtsH [Streptococcus mitis]MDK7308036.1 ATP-dependent zinc metalloprotease FtsH [Streptococcus oralis]MDK7311735.1 ATP-dependent zinc metalloprotease FtsH [Streptococcus oralis]MQP61039.1 ATP-dependent zinc metalloprotease FtsH [Streptococcus mitis]MQP70522.1 ATP-dependent zinc metalloprotease FtsH [Streptococcus mitis]
MKKQNNGLIKNPFLWLLLIFLLVTGYQYFSTGSVAGKSEQINYTELVKEITDDNVKELTYQPNGSVIEVSGVYKNPKTSKEETGIQFFSPSATTVEKFSSIILPSDTTVSELQKLASDHKAAVTIKHESSSGMWINILVSIVPFGILFFFLFSMMGNMGGNNSRNPMSFGRSKAKAANKEDIKVRFSDVAGAEEEKQELVEVVEFLKDPKRFTKLGARIPAGVLLEGPPGTGKTLLAKAVAGEAGVPFFSISGSDFVEMFVGVGASRVRSLFEDAKKAAPAIIFIDEIDAVGRQRGVGLGGGNDEREQTLNQLLIEMDGFEGNEGIIVIAATNRSDVLDPALLRPGRFDRKVLVGRPDVKGREAILKVHAKNKPLAEDVDLKLVAQQTPGFVGADLENVLNEAALVAARRNKSIIDASDIDEAEDRVIAGPSKKDKTVSQKERELVAYHEAGHTIVGLVLSNARVVHKVTIVPRGRAGGYMIALPKEDQMLLSKEDMKEQLAGLMGGRVAEEIIFNVQTTGASNDFEQATQMARAMVTEYGMSEKLGPVQYEGNHAMFGAQSSQKSISEQTAYEIDEEVRSLLNEARNKAAEIIQSNRETHKLIAEALLKYETLDSTQIKSLYETGKMPETVEEESHALSYDEVKSKMNDEK